MASNRNPKSRKLAKGTVIMIGTTLLALALVFVAVGQVFADSSADAGVLGLKINDADGAYIESDDIQPVEFPADTTADEIAEEPARYNFASVQGASSLGVIPGGEVSGVIRFYNVDGNRITHIALELAQAPDGWEVEIVTENLHAEPTELSPEPIEDVPDGMVCLTVGNRGYALAKVATVIVRVPESEEVGTEGDIKITAVASWLGQTGAATISQTRDFDFTVKLT